MTLHTRILIRELVFPVVISLFAVTIVFLYFPDSKLGIIGFALFTILSRIVAARKFLDKTEIENGVLSITYSSVLAKRKTFTISLADLKLLNISDSGNFPKRNVLQIAWDGEWKEFDFIDKSTKLSAQKFCDDVQLQNSKNQNTV